MDLDALAQKIGTALKDRHLTMTAAESCTGGWIAETVTSIAGSSQWFERGFVVYSNIAKQEMLGVSPALLLQYGAVSEPVAKAMAEGALVHSRAQVAVAVTGIAGPDGGSAEKPVGTVWMAWAGLQKTTVAARYQFDGDRANVRRESVCKALTELLRYIVSPR
jgi:nicotinamide-nucleotide amidase